ncbi:MAG: lactonase family protein [Isosphaeraceae bacterium]|nr:lactonase family protein [Isosphaeraceae bacterium]
MAAVDLWPALLLACASAAIAQDRPAPRAGQASPAPLRAYIGTYTGDKSKGIYLLELDPSSGQVAFRGLISETTSPSFLAIHPNHRFLYAVNEVSNFGGERTGSVSAFAIEPENGSLLPLNRQSAHGAGPCYITVDRKGRHALVANYGSGSVTVLPIGDDGRLGEATATVQHQGSSVHPRRQEGPHAHSINLDAENRFAVAADLGLDKLLVYRFDAARGTLTPNDPPSASVAPGSGPRHFAFHPNGRLAYVINEMKSTVTAFVYDPERGTLKEIQTISTLPEGFQGTNYTAEVQVHPSGRFLYGSNRGHDSIAIFTIDPITGRLTSVGQEPTRGKTPRHFGIDPSGRYLLAANQDSDSVVVFRIDPQTGRLEATGQTIEVPKPVCVKFVPLP